MGIPEWDDWLYVESDSRDGTSVIGKARTKKSWDKGRDGVYIGPTNHPRHPRSRLPTPIPAPPRIRRAQKRGIVVILRRRIGPLVAIVCFILLVQALREWRYQKQYEEALERAVSQYDEVDSTVFVPSTAKSPSVTHSKMLVVARTSQEDTEWITKNFGGSQDIQSTIYTVDDPSAPHHPPANKGHEVMVYLSYIIDHYHNLSDVTIFMHAHQYAWHNSELLDNDAVTMVRRLSGARVLREGYVNLRCEWTPGCPAWMRPYSEAEDENKKEQKSVLSAWAELFPAEDVPELLAQPCCAQFAVSAERIQELSWERYEALRRWLLETELSDYVSGRVWEYTWQYLFTGQNVVCPKEHVCYCDGYGVCFGGEEQFKEWRTKLNDKRHYDDEIRNLNDDIFHLKAEFEYSRKDSRQEFIVPEDQQSRMTELQDSVARLTAWLVLERKAAFDRGDDPVNRAIEAGRKWNDGDGF